MGEVTGEICVKKKENPLSVYMPEDEKDEVREYAKSLDRSTSWVIRSLLRRELNHPTLIQHEGNN